MNLFETADYLANLAALIDFHEDFGGPKNKWILEEFNAVNTEFLNALKDKHDETRKRTDPPSGSENGTEAPRSKPSVGQSTRQPRSEEPRENESGRRV